MEYRRIINGLEVRAEYSEKSVEKLFLPLLRNLTELYQSKNRRITVLLAAPPAAGKSTLASFLQYLSETTEGLEPVTAIGMDGFHHYQDFLLSHTVIQNGEEIPMVKVKGAPITFDREKLEERLAEVSSGMECFWPDYDRTKHNPVDGVRTVTGNIIMLEGNYLLLDEPGWRKLRNYSDFNIFILADEENVRQRLIDRKAASVSYEEAVLHVESSDLPNVRECLTFSSGADIILRLLPDGEYIFESGHFPLVEE